MDKINYNQHDWSKGEVIKEENLDNMENGIKQATDKINEIIDTEQDFQDRMTDIDGRIDINNEELVIARDGCDNLGQRIERDQQYIYNILNDGSYLEFNGTDIDINNAKDGYTKDTILKGQTYQNLMDFNRLNKNYYEYSNGILKNINNGIDDRLWSAMEVITDLLKKNTDYTFIVTNLTPNTRFGYKCDNIFNSIEFNGVGEIKVLKFTIGDIKNIRFRLDRTIDTQTDVQIKVALLEGDWTNREVPSEITGIESVGEKENNKISILSHNKNLATIATKGDTNFKVGYIKQGKNYTISFEGNSNGLNLLYYYNNSPREQIIGNVWNNITSFTSQKDCMLYINSHKGQTLTNIMLVEGEYNSDTMPKFELPKQDKKEILFSLEGGLKSLPNGVCDTIEQKEDGFYLVQRIGKIVLNGQDLSWRVANNDKTNTINFVCSGISSTKENDFNIICDKFIIGNMGYGDDVESLFKTSDGVYISILRSRLSSQDGNGLRAWLENNPVTVYYELATAIETKLDIDTINLQVFKDKTYILSENSIKPEIVCKAPVDVNQTIADLQEEQKRLMETYNTLKAQNEEVEMAISELNGQDDVQTADMLDLDMRVLALEEGL